MTEWHDIYHINKDYLIATCSRCGKVSIFNIKDFDLILTACPDCEHLDEDIGNIFASFFK